MTAEQIRHARDLLTRPENTVASIATLLGVSRNTIYKYLPEPKQGRAALTAVRSPTDLATLRLAVALAPSGLNR